MKGLWIRPPLAAGANANAIASWELAASSGPVVVAVVVDGLVGLVAAVVVVRAAGVVEEVVEEVATGVDVDMPGATVDFAKTSLSLGEHASPGIATSEPTISERLSMARRDTSSNLDSSLGTMVPRGLEK